MKNSDNSNEENIGNMLSSAYGKTTPPPEYRARLLQELKMAANIEVVHRPLWRMTDWAIIAAVIISIIIIYGLWLPQHVLTELAP